MKVLSRVLIKYVGFHPWPFPHPGEGEIKIRLYYHNQSQIPALKITLSLKIQRQDSQVKEAFPIIFFRRDQVFDYILEQSCYYYLIN